MSKRKRKRRKRRTAPTARPPEQPLDQKESRWSRRSSSPNELQAALERADRLIARGHARAAGELLEPLLASYPRVAELHYTVGHAHDEAGDIWTALDGYERALELSRDPGYQSILALQYLKIELRAHGLSALRQLFKQQAGVPLVEQMRDMAAALEQEVAELAHDLGLSVRQVEEGLYHMERGQRALHKNDFPACISASQRAIKSLRDWPPPHNNLAMALFFDGQPEKSIATTRQVLSHAPDNVHALSNGIRFLAWTGQETEARALWPQLKKITPQGHSEHLKIVEAAAILDEDASVYQLLRPLDKPGAVREIPPRLAGQARLFMAVAEANTGRRRAAQRRLKVLQRDAAPSWAGELLAALEAGRPGPGWAERFPYFHSTELMDMRKVGELVELVTRQEDLSTRRFRSQVARFVARFPQVVLMAEKLIWEENQPDVGFSILVTVAIPAAHAILRRFALSQAGEDDLRMRALTSLMEAGEITEDTILRMWIGGEWRDVQLRQQYISAEPDTDYTPQVDRLLERGLIAFQRDDYEQAERLFRRALELEPRAKEAYNNLGALYAHRKEHAQAREMFRAALEINPLYVFPRCNLASYLLDEGDVAGATDMLRPLADVTRLHPQEIAFHSYVQARILVRQEEYERARRTLQVALEIHPGYEPAEKLLERLDTITRLQTGFQSFLEGQHKRDAAARARLQARLSTPDPALSQALSIYTKDALTGIGRAVLRGDGWSGLRKAELLQRIVTELCEPDNLKRVVTGLDDEERAALRQTLAKGGSMPWQEFDAHYGNDLEESPYWNYHTPETTMGRLRLRGLLVEVTVDGELGVAVPGELRLGLQEILA